MKQNLQKYKATVAATGAAAIIVTAGAIIAMPPGTMRCIMQETKLDRHQNLMLVLSSFGVLGVLRQEQQQRQLQRSVELENANGTNVGRNTRKGLVKTLLKNPGW